MKFPMARKKFKDVVSKKIGQSFEDEEDSGLITKKIWFMLKQLLLILLKYQTLFNAHLDNSFKSNPLDQAHLFNFHFYNHCVLYCKIPYLQGIWGQ